MKTFLKAVVLPAAIVLPLSVLGACSETVASKSRTQTNWDGSKTHTSEEVRRNPDGTYTTDRDSVKVR